MVQRFIAFVNTQPKPVLAALGFVALILLGIGDYFATSNLLEFSVFFVLPIAFFSWFVGYRAGALGSIVSAAVILGVNLNSPVHEINRRVAYWNALVWLGFFLLITLLMAQLKTLHDRERELARVDSLTGVATRLAFYEFATTEISRARRTGLPTTFVYIDLDSFKQINDRDGHAMGDRVLIMVARCMQTTIRETDIVARMGGDEFALMLPSTDKEAARKVLGKLLHTLCETMRQNRWPITFSAGAVTFLSASFSVHEMIRRADETMYAVKQSGKNSLRQEEWAA